MLDVYIVLFLALSTTLFLKIGHLKYKESFAATDAWCDASERFRDWRLKNQGVYIGLSNEGKKLLIQLIDAYDWFLDTHKYIDDNGHREYLISLFYEMPPKSPNEIKTIDKKKKRNSKGSSFIFEN